MKATLVLLSSLVMILTILVHSVCKAGSDDFPGGQDEEEVHVYKKYARYPLYFYTYRSPHLNQAPYQLDKEWNSGLDPSEADNQALSHFESLPQRNIGDQESFSKLQEILYHDLDPEMHHLNPAMSSGGYTRNKKSSVSWLLAAAIRMCQKHPEQCLKKDMQPGKMDYKGLVDGGR